MKKWDNNIQKIIFGRIHGRLSFLGEMWERRCERIYRAPQEPTSSLLRSGANIGKKELHEQEGVMGVQWEVIGGQWKVSGRSWEVNEGFWEVSGRSRGGHWRSLGG